MPRLNRTYSSAEAAARLVRVGMAVRSNTRRGRYFVSGSEWLSRAQMLNRFYIPVGSRWGVGTSEQIETPVQPEVLRTIRRLGYHRGERNVLEALERIPLDIDGVRRSYGLEYEIYSLDETQEDKLAKLLDTLPPHITESDGSLRESGVEIVFEPMSEAIYRETFLKLKQFVIQNDISMENTGAHTTYGVNNAMSSKKDIQIRLNRYALAIKSVALQRNIESMFGRDFSSYCQLPQTTLADHHSNAFSNNGRNSTCWEMRLMNWKADIEKVIELFKITETVFYRPTNANDFIKIFNLMGADTSEQ